MVICKQFAQMMGGDITVKSTPGSGSTFILRVPARAKPGRSPYAIVEKVEKEVAQPAAPKGRVLIIDDDEAVHAVLTNMLTREGYSTRIARDGKEGVKIARDYKPDLIVLDILMPGTDGWGVLAQLKAMPGMADTPIILLTMLENKEMGFALGAADYLTKPIEAQKLLPVLERHNSKQRSGVVLVVEDDPPSRELVVRMLEKEGLAVKEASNGKEALELLQSGVVPAMIVLDLMMAEMNGFEFLSHIRPHPEWSKIPVVVVSSLDLSSETRQVLKGQVEKIFQKGRFSREDLLKEVRETVQHQLQQRRAAAPAAGAPVKPS